MRGHQETITGCDQVDDEDEDGENDEDAVEEIRILIRRCKRSRIQRERERKTLLTRNIAPSILMNFSPFLKHFFHRNNYYYYDCISCSCLVSKKKNLGENSE